MLQPDKPGPLLEQLYHLQRHVHGVYVLWVLQSDKPFHLKFQHLKSHELRIYVLWMLQAVQHQRVQFQYRQGNVYGLYVPRLL